MFGISMSMLDGEQLHIPWRSVSQITTHSLHVTGCTHCAADKKNAYVTPKNNNKKIGISSLPPSIPLFPLLRLLNPIMMYTPQTHSHPGQTGRHSDKIRVPITIDTIFTISSPVWQYNRMLVIDVSVDEIEDVAENNRRQRHAAPILAEAADTEGFGDEGGVHAEEEAIG